MNQLLEKTNVDQMIETLIKCKKIFGNKTLEETIKSLEQFKSL